MKHHVLSAALIAATSFIGFAFAVDETDHKCADLVKECFAYARSERDTCFKGVSSHPFCIGTRIAKLADKRLQLSPSLSEPAIDGPAFLGPQLVDSDCLANFDSAWSSELVKGNISEDEYRTLTNSLDQCARIPASEVVRP